MVKNIICLVVCIIVFFYLGMGSYKKIKTGDVMRDRFYAILIFCAFMVVLSVFSIIRLLYKLL
jgi:hypothetical protein